MRYVWILCFALLAGCRGGDQKSKEAQGARKFDFLQPPSTMSDPQVRAQYLAANFWNRFDFADTTWLDDPDVVEQAMVDYIDMLNYVPLDAACAALRKLVHSATADTAMYHYFESLLDKYLYDPNSPMRNETFYIPVLEEIIASPRVEELEKIRPRHRLELALKNRPGNPALDFHYTLASGSRGTLYGVKAEYTLLYFYNPGCTTCREVQAQIMASPPISALEREGRLKVLTVYPDEDLTEWKNHLGDMPANWINGYDKGTVIQSAKLYDLKAIPTLYLLDRSKNVLMKDVGVARIEQYLTTNVR